MPAKKTKAAPKKKEGGKERKKEIKKPEKKEIKKTVLKTPAKKEGAKTEKVERKAEKAGKSVEIERVKKAAAKLEALEKIERDEEVTSQAAKGGSFIPAVGRRKSSIARVRLIKNGKGVILINGRSLEQFFTTFDLVEQIKAPLRAAGQETSVDVSAVVHGGGIRGQAEAVRHGLARALVELNPTFRKALKKLGYLKRDARKRERKKFGLKAARRAPQWSKR